MKLSNLVKLVLVLILICISDVNAWRRRRRRRCDSSACVISWGACYPTCGTGTKSPYITRNRGACGPACNLPAPKSCSSGCCPKNCEWGEWVTWSGCSSECGPGTRTRTRTSNPESCNGTPCSGSNEQTEPCDSGCCPVDCAWGEWQAWEKCNVFCGDGEQTRIRMIGSEASCGGKACEGITMETKPCNAGCCPVHCQWGDWQDWGRCSTTCGNGVKTRSRDVAVVASCNGNACEGEGAEAVECKESCCPVDCVWDKWDEWGACSATCGQGEQMRRRKKLVDISCGGDCPGFDFETRSCEAACCPVNCMWEEWSAWTECSHSCGEGMKRRSRKIKHPASCNGIDCVGEVEDFQNCFLKKCPIICDENPATHYTRLPLYCDEEDGSPRYVATGYCPRMRCGEVDADSGLENCCGAIETTTIKADCGSFTVPITKILTCGCHACDEEVVPINFMVVGSSKSDLVDNCVVKRGDRVLGRTNDRGVFSMQLPMRSRKITFTFIDNSGRFLPTTKTINIRSENAEVVNVVKMILKPPVQVSISTQASVVKMSTPVVRENGEIQYDGFFGEMAFPEFSVVTPQGDVYEGEFETNIYSVSKNSEVVMDFAPGDFRASSEDGNEATPLRNYGLFEVFIQDNDGHDLHANSVEVKFDAAIVSNENELNNMYIFSFDEGSGMWDNEGKMEVYRDDSEEQSAVFLIANISLTSRRLWSLNTIVEEYCYAKVRTYLSNLYDSRDQVNDVDIRALYFDGFGQSAGYSLEHTQSGLGACVMVPCTGEDRVVTDILFSASIGDEIGFFAAPSDEHRNVTGLSDYTMNRINYKRSDHEDEDFSGTYFNITIEEDFHVADNEEPPFYHYTKLEQCLMAPYESQHFRFFKDEAPKKKSIIYEFNSVSAEPYSENSLNWYPQQSDYQMCFIKVKITGSAETLVQASSTRSMKDDLEGSLYGFRQNFTVGSDENSITCLEYKCSNAIQEQERPLVRVKPLHKSCSLGSVNMFLEFYLNAFQPATKYTTGDPDYSMYAPIGDIGGQFGIFVSSDSETKQELFSKCMSSSSGDGVGYAVQFNCDDSSIE